MDDLTSLSEQLQRHARSLGADAAEVLVLRTDRRRTTSAGPGVSHDTEVDLQVRVFAGGRAGVARRAALDVDSGRAAIAEALEGAADGPAGVAAPRLDVGDRGLDINDRRYPNIDDDGRREAVEWNVEGCAGVDRAVQVGTFAYDEIRQRRVLQQSGRRALVEESHRYRLSGQAWHRDCPEAPLTEVCTSRNFAEVASRPLGVMLGQRALRQGTRANLPAEPTPIVLAQRVVAELLPRIVRPLRAERAGQAVSFLGRHAGERIASPVLHVVDDARVSGGYATRAFDDRGVPSLPVSLIKEGILGGAYHGVTAAHGADARPSGHETFDGELWLGNLIVRPGNRSRNMVFPELGTFVEIEDLDGVISVNEGAGTVSIPARVWVKEAGTDHGYAGTHVLAAPIVDLLGAVAHACSDQERHGIVDTPTWVLQGPWFEG